MPKVIVFGLFDGLHENHRAFLEEAKKYGDYLIAVIAQNHILRHIKGYEPRINIAERLEHLRRDDGVDEVVIGDEKMAFWQIAQNYRPDVIAVGKDQKWLKEDLKNNLAKLDFKPKIKMLKNYESNLYHSALLEK